MPDRATYEVREVPYPTPEPGPALKRFSQYQVRDRSTKFVVGLFDSEAEANLVAARKNYSSALRLYSDWAQYRSEGYNLDIEHDRLNRIPKRDAFQSLAKKSLEESARVDDFDHRPRIHGQHYLKP